MIDSFTVCKCVQSLVCASIVDIENPKKISKSKLTSSSFLADFCWIFLFSVEKRARKNQKILHGFVWLVLQCGVRACVSVCVAKSSPGGGETERGCRGRSASLASGDIFTAQSHRFVDDDDDHVIVYSPSLQSIEENQATLSSTTGKIQTQHT